MLAGLHPRMRGRSLVKREAAVDDGLQAPALNVRPDGPAISSATIVLNSTDRERSVEPVSVSRRRMMSKIGTSAVAPCWTAIET